ncbi:MAG TPA: porin [Stellaceae bacterium]|nr:porin [Stellaceae bacterium]
MMKNRRNAVITAAIACMLAVPLVIGPYAARADDLQTNPELLQRLDQLAQVGTAKPQLPPGTATNAGSFPRSFLIPGTDTSLQVGGLIRLTADYWFSGGNTATSTGGDGDIAGVPGASGAQLNVPGNTAKSRSNSVFAYNIWASRMFVETRTPTVYGGALTHIEFDFLGCSLGGIVCNNTVAGNNGLGARLRLAYATLGPFAAGQQYGPGTDLAASPESVEFGCCAGEYGIGRLPQVVYTFPPFPTPAGPATLAVALVDPEDSAATPQGQTLTNNTNLQNVSLAGVAFGINPATGLPFSQANTSAGLLATLNGGSNQLISANPLKASYPDPVAGLTWQQPWGHVKLSGVVHQAALVDGAHIDRQYIGYGGAVSGDVKPGWLGWLKDDIGFTGFAGNGLGRYAGGGGAGNYFPYLATKYGAPAGPLGASVGNPCGYGHLGVPTAGPGNAACAAGVRAQTIPEWGTEIWYQHWWSPTLRSTAEFGVTHQDVATALVGSQGNGGPGAVNKEIVDSQINLLWSPVPFIDTGFEYLWTHRQTIYNQKGDQNVLLYLFAAKF